MTVNSIERFTEDSFTVGRRRRGERSEAEVGAGVVTKETALLLDSLILGLQGIEEDTENISDVNSRRCKDHVKNEPSVICS